jgi:hypothetical protein
MDPLDPDPEHGFKVSSEIYIYVLLPVSIPVIRKLFCLSSVVHVKTNLFSAQRCD